MNVRKSLIHIKNIYSTYLGFFPFENFHKSSAQILHPFDAVAGLAVVATPGQGIFAPGRVRVVTVWDDAVVGGSKEVALRSELGGQVV